MKTRTASIVFTTATLLSATAFADAMFPSVDVAPVNAPSEAGIAPVACPPPPVLLAQAYADAVSAKSAAFGTFERFDRLLDFDVGRVRVHSKDRAKLAAIARMWKHNPNEDVVSIEAFASVVERDGAALAEKRAAVIKNYLVRYGVAADRIVVKSSLQPGTVAGVKSGLDLTIGEPSACTR